MHRTILVALLALTGCSFATGHIPATSTPEREARYYRTQDAANFAAGVSLDLLLRNACHGPTQQIAVQLDSTGQWRPYKRWFTGASCPIFRVGVVTAAGGIYRATSPDYRESGWLFNVFGAGLTEVLHLFVDAMTKHWGPVR
jgi:hypothetical protein